MAGKEELTIVWNLEVTPFTSYTSEETKPRMGQKSLHETDSVRSRAQARAQDI